MIRNLDGISAQTAANRRKVWTPEQREIRLNYDVTVPRPRDKAGYHSEPEFRFPKPEKPFEDKVGGWIALMVVVGAALIVCAIVFVHVWNGATP